MLKETSADVTAENNLEREDSPVSSAGATVNEGGLEYQADDGTERSHTILENERWIDDKWQAILDSGRNWHEHQDFYRLPREAENDDHRGLPFGPADALE